MHISMVKRLSGLSSGFCEVIGKAMQTNNEKRFVSAKEMRKAMRDTLNKYTIFISYRQKSEHKFAKMLYEELNSQKTPAGKLVSVFLDQVCLKDGDEWADGFCEGLFNSRIYMPLITAGFTGSNSQFTLLPFHSSVHRFIFVFFLPS